MSDLGLESHDQAALRATALGSPQATRDYAGWWVRVGAYLIDLILLLAGFFVVALIGGAISKGVGIVLIILWIVVWAIGYWTYFEGSESGQTIGKRAVGIRVRDSSGGRAGYGQAFARNLVARVIGLIPFVGLIDVLWPLWDDDKQCLHDKAASTIVVRG
jgi:uncharacterized RDD family membrane protein YckC